MRKRQDVLPEIDDTLKQETAARVERTVRELHVLELELQSYGRPPRKPRR